MTADLAETLRSHPEFSEAKPDEFVVDGLDFDGTVHIEDGATRLKLELPTLDAVVEGETVAEVVQTGWAETFEARAVDVTNLSSVPQTEPAIHAGADRIEVTMTVEGDESIDPDGLIHAANFVESVWVEGIIPGYDYEKRVQAIRERAAETGNTP